MSLTSKDLINAGIKPGELFGRILKGCNTIEEAKAVWDEHQQQKEKSVIVGKRMITGSFWEWLVRHSAFAGMVSREFPGSVASNSEKRRWLESGGIRVNLTFPKPDDVVQWPIEDLVFFPKSDLRITMI